ncbi:MAG: S-adenosylmethionine decarboxylase [Leptospiraceae bacterium]|nr:S-adenosylmethionine decarboxylase [Leptospiraceae bacterium]MCP5502486.1 S-adenosylmethionine decarboxylase [Leptospiraceae bacterium]
MITNTGIKTISRYSFLNSHIALTEVSEGRYTLTSTAPIRKGETVAIWGGKVVSSEKLNTLQYSSAHQIESDFFLVTPIHDDGPESIHYIKVAENPNCETKGQITLVAAREINAGEEITYNPAIRNFLSPTRASEFFKRGENSFADGAWGLLSSIDLVNCKPATIRDAEAIKRYVYELCDLIDMKRFGECHVVHFGEDERVAGFSMFQLIETSCISAHFANESNTSYIDIFSCKAYDPVVAAEFTKKFFEGSNYRMTVTNRF